MLFVGWKMKKADVLDELTSGGTVRLHPVLFNVLHFVIRWIIPVIILFIIVRNLFG